MSRFNGLRVGNFSSLCLPSLIITKGTLEQRTPGLLIDEMEFNLI